MSTPDSSAGWRVEVERSACMGLGQCIVYAGGTFSHDAETKAVASFPLADPLDVVRDAVDACPTGALTLVHEEQ